MAFKPKRIFLHHSLTPDSGSVSWGAIRIYHTLHLGWSDIGYHAGVELVFSGGETYYEILMGRSWDRQGAHAKGQNKDSLALCFIGNFDLEEPPIKQLISGAKVVSLWMKLFDLSLKDIYLHRHFAQKSCPGSKFNLEDFKIYIS